MHILLDKVDNVMHNHFLFSNTVSLGHYKEQNAYFAR